MTPTRKLYATLTRDLCAGGKPISTFFSENEAKSMASQQRKNGGGGGPRERKRSGEERKQELQFSGPIIIFFKKV